MPFERTIAPGGPRGASDPWRTTNEVDGGATASIAAERRIAERFARLHAAAVALSAALTSDDVAAAITARGVALPGVAACAVAFLSPEGGALEFVAVRGVRGGRAVERVPPCPVSADLPVAIAARERRSVFVSVVPAPGARPCEAAVPCGFCTEGHPALAAFPLAPGDRVLGAIALAFAAPRGFDEEERAFLEAFAHHCGQALERARLYEAERAARIEAQRAAEAARHAVELQEQLVGIVGHDLRTPLAAIRMATGLLFRRGGLSEEQARTLARLGASAARMTSIIRDLLDYTRVRKGGTLSVHPCPADLAELAVRAVGELHEVHPEREIALDLPAGAPIVGDPERLVQVISNLVGNALQHSPPDAQVRVAVREAAGGLVLEVHNDGPPIRPEFLPELFEPFRQGAHRGDASGSIGLGLFIVRELVRAHLGTVEILSTHEEGTTFTVRLPRPVVSEAPSGRAAPER